jgi:NAD+ kinase
VTRLGLHANPLSTRALDLARNVAEKLKGRAELVYSRELGQRLGVSGIPLEGLEADLVISLGGDGSILRTVRRTPCPVLGIKAGTVGFLAEVDPERDSLDAALERVLRGDYYTEERMRIGTQVGERVLPDALNEVVVHAAQVARMRHFELSVDGKPVGRLRADGMIVASPTGSTSYAMSCGGPAVDPALDAILVTALAPFASAPRTLVVSPYREVSLRCIGDDRPTVLVIDGQEEVPLGAGETVRCYRSGRRARLVRFSPRFFQRLQYESIVPWDPPENPHASLPSSS